MPRFLRGLAVCLLPLLAGLDVATSTFPGGLLLPWRATMVDLGVYREAGRVALAGGDFYTLPGPLQFLYPPFAALLAVPLAVLPAAVVEVAWTVAGVLALVAVVHRYGLQGWRLSGVATVAVLVAQPVVQTLAFGQLGILLCALVVLDLAPGPRALPGRRLLPTGALVGVAAALKLTPAIFVLYLLAVRRWRDAAVASAAGAAATVLAAVALPSASWTFWSRLAGGETGLGGSIIYYTNQSVLASTVRILGLGGAVSLFGLILSAGVVVLGVLVAARWSRRGAERWAVVLCGVAGLLASPVSWLHHFVWIVPLAVCLACGGRDPAEPRSNGPVSDGPVSAGPVLPDPVLALGWAFVGWVAVSPYRRLPNGADVELTWAWWEHALASVTVALGVAWLGAALVVVERTRRSAAVR